MGAVDGQHGGKMGIATTALQPRRRAARRRPRRFASLAMSARCL
jgi:hypothetical protein